MVGSGLVRSVVLTGSSPVRAGLVTVVGQQVAHMVVAEGTQSEGPFAGRLQPCLAISARQVQQSQAGAVAVFGMLVGLQQPGDEFAACHADALAPIDQPLRRPLQVGAVGSRHVGLHRGVAAAALVASVGGHALAAQQQLHAVAGEARLQGLADERMRHAVAVALHLDVVVDVDLHRLEAGKLIGLARQRHQCRRIQFGEHAGAAAGQLLKRPVVHAR